MSVRVSGGGFVTTKGYGTMDTILPLPLIKGSIEIPDASQLFTETQIPARFGRFDTFTKLGFMAAALALKDAGYSPDKNNICGMIAASLYDTVNTDRSYYETTLEQDGFLSSPNLFSYTLPVIMLGESCIVFSITGPAFCVGNERGRDGLTAVETALRLIETGKTGRMLAGWVEDPPPETDDPPVSVFIFMEKTSDHDSRSVVLDNGCLKNVAGIEIKSIMDFFKT